MQNQQALSPTKKKVKLVTKEITLSGGFFADTDFDFDARLALGAAACGIGDTGLVLATLDRVVDGDRQGWFDAWCDVAATLADQGQEAAGRGHSRTARLGPRWRRPSTTPKR